MSNIATAAADYIERYGLALVQLEPGQKGPTHKGWNQPGGYFDTAGAAEQFFASRRDWGIGAVLGPSRLCSLDIDHVEHSRIVFSEFGIDIDGLAAEHPTITGRPDRFRIMFTIPDGAELSRVALQWPDQDDHAMNHVVFELRAGPVQDVLPPTIHPDTHKPYAWRTQPNGEFPTLPEELLTIWRNWGVFKPQAEQLCPWTEKPTRPARSHTRAEPAGGDSVIDKFVAAHPLDSILERYGYEPRGRRWLSPHSTTKLPGVVPLDDLRVFMHHASDPLFCDHPLNAFDFFCHYEYGGDIGAAVKAAARDLGLGAQQPRQPADPLEVPAWFDSLTPPDDAGIGARPKQHTRTALLPGAADELLVIRDGYGPLIPVSKRDKSPANCEANALRIIRAHPPAAYIYFDDFDQRIMLDGPRGVRTWQDEDDVGLTATVQQYYAPKMTRAIVRAALDLVARDRSRDSLLEFLETLPQWDGVARIESLFVDAAGAADTAHNRAAGRNLLIAMAARALRPGCEVHFAVIMEGPQGIGKNDFYKALGGNHYVESRSSIESTDFLRVLRGSWLVHMGELGAIKRADIELVKDRIAANSDTFVEKYERITRQYPRRCVIVGSTNKEQYLADETGNRRFIPVSCGKAPLRVDLVRANREQLLAEALHRFNAGETWYEWPAETLGEQAERETSDPWHDRVAAYLDSRQDSDITIANILGGPLELEPRHMDKVAQMRVAAILGRLRWARVGRHLLPDKSRTTVYRHLRPDRGGKS